MKSVVHDDQELCFGMTKSVVRNKRKKKSAVRDDDNGKDVNDWNSQ